METAGYEMHEVNGKNGKARTGQCSGQGLSIGSKRTQFKQGHHGGRKLGSQNQITRVLKDAVLLAAEAAGDLSGIENLSESGVEHGKNGLVGYLLWASKTQPKAFISLLGRLLPMQVNVDRYSQTIYKSYQEVSIALGDHGLSLDTIEKLKKIDLKPDPVEEEE
jgi:hypothetical protein